MNGYISSLFIFLIFLIIIFALFLLIIFINNDDTDDTKNDGSGTQGETCTSNFDCEKGLVCQNYKNILTCQKPPSLGEICQNYCGEGFCSNAVLKNALGKNLYPNVTISIQDATVIQTDFSFIVVLLLQNGDFIVDINGSLTFITSTVQMDTITFFKGNLYGISKGLLYKINNFSDNAIKWGWTLQEWAPTDLIFLSTTINQDYLWLQQQIINNLSNFNGYLYQDENFLIENEIIEGYRNYGNSPNNYIQFSGGNGFIEPDNTLLNNIYYGILLPSPTSNSLQPEIINLTEGLNYRKVYNFNGSPVFLTQKLCKNEFI